MIKGKCPTCGKGYEIAKLGDLATFPFCSERCRLVDLGRWIDGRHAIPGDAAPSQPLDAGDEPDDD